MQQLFKAVYYTQLGKIEENIPFFDWRNDFLPKHQFSIPNYNKYLLPLSENYGAIFSQRKQLFSLNPHLSLQSKKFKVLVKPLFQKKYTVKTNHRAVFSLKAQILNPAYQIIQIFLRPLKIISIKSS